MHLGNNLLADAVRTLGARKAGRVVKRRLDFATSLQAGGDEFVEAGGNIVIGLYRESDILR
jgi:hypothetical protein